MSELGAQAGLVHRISIKQQRLLGFSIFPPSMHRETSDLRTTALTASTPVRVNMHVVLYRVQKQVFQYYPLAADGCQWASVQ